MFKKIINQIIEREVVKNSTVLREKLDQLTKKFKSDTDLEIALLQNEYEKIKSVYNSKTEELKELTQKVDYKISALENTRKNAEEEQKFLWERLDILKDNLNTQDVWTKLWECAYSKAVDIVWEIFKKETLHLIERAKEDAYIEGEKKSKEGYEAKLQDLINQSTGVINVPLLLIKEENAKGEYLKANKSRDAVKEQFFLGQLKLVEEVRNKK